MVYEPTGYPVPQPAVAYPQAPGYPQASGYPQAPGYPPAQPVYGGAMYTAMPQTVQYAYPR